MGWHVCFSVEKEIIAYVTTNSHSLKKACLIPTSASFTRDHIFLYFLALLACKSRLVTYGFIKVMLQVL